MVRQSDTPTVELRKMLKAVQELAEDDKYMTLLQAQVYLMVAMDRGTTHGSLKKRLGVSHSVVSRAIRNLLPVYGDGRQGAGLIMQTEDPYDRRTVHLQLTDQGEARMYRVADEMRDYGTVSSMFPNTEHTTRPTGEMLEAAEAIEQRVRPKTEDYSIRYDEEIENPSYKGKGKGKTGE